MSDRYSHTEMASLMTAMANMKEQWIHNHSGGREARPEWTIELARRDLKALRQAQDDYAAAANKVAA